MRIGAQMTTLRQISLTRKVRNGSQRMIGDRMRVLLAVAIITLAFIWERTCVMKGWSRIQRHELDFVL